ncbi:MAG: Antibiotic biosynthesis monooxygenase [Variovorax sp.]|nr:Antibiotic biosynthesis monooxygenase [Variovorax sp.]
MNTLAAAEGRADAVSIVTQTRIVPGRDVEFAIWQESVIATISRQAGFLDQKVLPPSPPAQVDWVIVQRFSSTAAAQQWLRSELRANLLEGVQHLLVGNDDIHLIQDGNTGVLPSPASAVISTRVRPGQEMAYRAWERRMAAVQAKAPGFQGCRTEAPVPGVQESWVAIVRFDSDVNLDKWMKSSERLKLLPEGEALSEDVRARIVHTGFDQWFPAGGTTGRAAPPPWKQNMLVLLMLYPVVFLFGLWVQEPVLMKGMGMPFWLALFFGNVASVLLLNFLVPWVCARFGWWLQPAAEDVTRVNRKGVAMILGIYAACLLVFSRLH